MTSRAHRRPVLAGTVLAPAAGLLVLLSGCGTTHPGAAAVVSGERISVETIDEAAAALCAAGAAQQVSDTAGARREVVETLVYRRVALDLAESAGVRVPESAWRLTATERDRLSAVAGDDPAALWQYVEALRELDAVAGALGPDGARRIRAAAADADVDVDPRFGSADLDPPAVLSALSDAEAPISIPETQICG